MMTRIPKPAKILGLLGLLPFLIALFSAISLDLQLSLETNLKINILNSKLYIQQLFYALCQEHIGGLQQTQKNKVFALYAINITNILYFKFTPIFS